MLARAAEAVRELMHRHLEHEEPLLFPELREHISPEQWAEFSREVVATSPQESAHLIVGFLDQVGTPEGVALVLDGLPMREQAGADLAVLNSATEN